MNRNRLILALWASLGALWAQTDINVNSRYTIQSVEISGGNQNRISRSLREDIESLVGKRLNQESLEKLARRIRTELHARLVAPKVTRGTESERVIVLFDVKGKRYSRDLDLSVPRGIYHSRHGWSGILDARFSVGNSQFSGGVANDGDQLIERYAGVRAGYQNRHVFSDRVRLGFQFASYHTQWDQDTLTALETASEVPGIYRTRQDFAPSVTFVLAEPLTLSVGASFQRFQKQFPAAHTEAANAVTTTLRYVRRLEDSEGNHHQLDAGYSLRAATSSLDSDYAYTRHEVDFDYAYTRGRQTLGLKLAAGGISGTPPLFERFVLGNSTTLRGWSKFDVAPLGGTRMAHAALEYGYHGFQVFYDTGVLRDDREKGDTKHSLGLGYRTKEERFFLALAFPVKAGRVQPIFMTGVTF